MTPSLFTLIVAGAGAMASTAGLLYWLLAFAMLGTTEAIGLPALGGASILAAPLFLPFLLVRTWLDRRGDIDLRRVPSPVFWMWAMALWGALSAVLLPRMFEGSIMVMTNNRMLGPGVQLVPLRPVSGNITQTVYLIGGAVAFTCVRGLTHSEARRRHFAGAVLMAGTLNTVATLFNFGEFYLGLPSPLPLLRTASYTIFQPFAGAGGLMRVQGTFAETSTYSAFTFPIFVYCLTLWLHRYRTAYGGTIALASLIFLLLSTSTTAYVSLALYMLFWGGSLAWKAVARSDSRRAVVAIMGGIVVALIVVSVLVFMPAFVERVSEFFEYTVFNKLASKSGEERSAWNRQAFRNFTESFGVGVGVGSAQGSSYPLTLLSNMGLLGAVLFVAFLVTAFRGQRAQREEAPPPVIAGRHAMLASLLAASVSGTSAALDIPFYAYAGVAASCVVHAPALSSLFPMGKGTRPSPLPRPSRVGPPPSAGREP